MNTLTAKQIRVRVRYLEVNVDQAVVFGASMSGLLAARALSDFYSKVLVVERDELPTRAQTRRGVPQGRHIHVLLARGSRGLEALFPGLTSDLVDVGVPHNSMMDQTRFLFSGYEMARGDCDAQLLQAARPTLEHNIRTRVAALPNVEIRSGCEATGLVVEAGRVTAATVVHSADGRTETIETDLVVDATGRGGRTKVWLSELGFEVPSEESIKCDLTYASRAYRMPADTLAPDQLVLVGPVPGRPRAMGMALVGGDRWMVSMAGMAGVRPPTDDEGYVDFAADMGIPDVCRALKAAEPLGDIVIHRFPASLRRRYERLRRFPDGLLAFGDAICSFNPIYGQGMTVAIMEAEALRRCLSDGRQDLPRRFFRAAAKVIDPPWQLAAGGDLTLPEVTGKRSASGRLINRYVAAMHRAAAHDPGVATVFMRVIGLLVPISAILKPGVMARVLRARLSRPRPAKA